VFFTDSSRPLLLGRDSERPGVQAFKQLSVAGHIPVRRQFTQAPAFWSSLGLCSPNRYAPLFVPPSNQHSRAANILLAQRGADCESAPDRDARRGLPDVAHDGSLRSKGRERHCDSGADRRPTRGRRHCGRLEETSRFSRGVRIRWIISGFRSRELAGRLLSRCCCADPRASRAAGFP
jgi:hypothetical protein